MATNFESTYFANVEAIKELIKKKGINLAILASMAPVSPVTLNNLLNEAPAKRTKGRIATFKKIAKILEVNHCKIIDAPTPINENPQSPDTINPRTSLFLSKWEEIGLKIFKDFDKFDETDELDRLISYIKLIVGLREPVVYESVEIGSVIIWVAVQRSGGAKIIKAFLGNRYITREFASLLVRRNGPLERILGRKLLTHAASCLFAALTKALSGLMFGAMPSRRFVTFEIIKLQMSRKFNELEIKQTQDLIELTDRPDLDGMGVAKDVTTIVS